MDALIKTAWRAFWVGLGASVVLIGQSVATPAPTSTSAESTAQVAPQAPTPVAPSVADIRRARRLGGQS